MADDRLQHVVDEDDEIQHGIDDEPSGDAEKGAALGGLGGAAVGAAAGMIAGPAGALAGAVIGGLAGAVASGIAVAAVDRIDNDDTVSGMGAGATADIDENLDDPDLVPGNRVPGVQTGGYANDGTPDTRGMMEKTADALTGDVYDDKTGKVVNHPDAPSPVMDRGYVGRTVGDADVIPGNRVPGIQTGGHANDGTPDTRGMMEKTADAVTGDVYDDKTGKVVNHPDMLDDEEDLVPGNRVPGIQTGGRNNDGSPDSRGVSEKVADAVTGDRYDDKTGKRI